MAQFGIRLRNISRGRAVQTKTGGRRRPRQSRNAVQLAAYISGTALTDHAVAVPDAPARPDYTTTLTRDVDPRASVRRRKAPPLHELHGAPPGMPPQDVWRAAGAKEGDRDGRAIAHRFGMSLPRALGPEQQVALAQRIAAGLRADEGVLVEVLVEKRRGARSARSQDATFTFSARKARADGATVVFGDRFAALDEQASARRWAHTFRKRVRHAVAEAMRESSRTAQTFDHRRKGGVIESALVGTPQSLTPEELWNRAERFAPRRDSVVARELIVSLPHELPQERQVALTRQIAGRLAQDLGVAVQYAVHKPKGRRKGVEYRRAIDDRNVHAHLLFTRTPVDPKTGRFQRVHVPAMPKKTRAEQGQARSPERVAAYEAEWRAALRATPSLQLERRTHASAWLTAFRADVARLANEELASAGIAARVDHRSLAAREILRLPDIPLGTTAARRIGQYRRRYEAGLPIAMVDETRPDFAEAQFRRHWDRWLLNNRIRRTDSRLAEIEIELLQQGVDPEDALRAKPKAARALSPSVEQLLAELREHRAWLRATFPREYRMPWERRLVAPRGGHGDGSVGPSAGRTRSPQPSPMDQDRHL